MITMCQDIPSHQLSFSKTFQVICWKSIANCHKTTQTIQKSVSRTLKMSWNETQELFSVIASSAFQKSGFYGVRCWLLFKQAKLIITKNDVVGQIADSMTSSNCYDLLKILFNKMFDEIFCNRLMLNFNERSNGMWRQG